jgi:hypothetical protein
VENGTRPTTLQEQDLVAALESLSALEDLLDALTPKIKEFDTRLCEAESRLENIVAERD